MANPSGIRPVNPFDNAFEMLGQVPAVTTPSVNAEELEQLVEALTTRAGEFGRIILLRSPRAGFGKTHLLMRLHQRVANSHEFIPLEPSKGRYLDDELVLDAVLRRFSRMLPAGGGLTFLDLLARRILAVGLEPLVTSGEVASQDRDGALQALRQRPIETFDFHNEDAVTAQWAKANFTLLGPRLTTELTERIHARFRPVAWWVELLFRYSSAPLDQSSRNGSLFETVFGGEHSETDMHEKLVTLLNLAGLVTSPVLVLDEVEGLSSSPEAGLQLATFLNTLHQSCKKLALIVSVNGDVWQTAFLPRLPCGLKDRFNDIVVDLKPMSKEDALLVLHDRAGDRADAIAAVMNFDEGVVYARGLVREASSLWDQMVAEDLKHVQEDAASGMEGLEASGSVVGAAEVPGGEALADDAEPEQSGEEASMVGTEPSDPFVQSAAPAAAPEPSSAFGAHQEESPEPVFPPRVEPQQQEASSPFTPDVAGQTHEQQQSIAGNALEEVSSGLAGASAESPFGRAASSEDDGPGNVINSPFSIDAEAGEAPEAAQPMAPMAPMQTGQPAGPSGAESNNPFVAGQDPIPPHAVTQEDHDKIEDLLNQFRDRYGRE